MTDCIRSLLNNCSHLKEFFILSNITFYHQSYLKIFFQLFLYYTYIYKLKRFFRQIQFVSLSRANAWVVVTR